MGYEIPGSVLDLLNARTDGAFNDDNVAGAIQVTHMDAANMDAPDVGLPYDLQNLRMPELDREEFADQPWIDSFIPLDPRRAPGVRTIEQIRSTYVAQWQIMNDYKNNIGVADVQFQRVIYGNQRYAITINQTNEDRDRDARNAQNGFAVDTLTERRYAAQESWRQLKNQLMSVGDPSIGIFGAVTHPDVPRSYSAFRPDSDAAPEDNLKLLVRAESRIGARTKQKENADSVIFTPDIYRELKQQPYTLPGGTNVTRTTLEQFLKNSVSIKSADMANELEGIGPNGEDAILYYTRDQRKLYGMIPLEYREDVPVRVIGGIDILCEGEVSGVHYRRPFSAEIQFVPAA